jgi:hypothetical protein
MTPSYGTTYRYSAYGLTLDVPFPCPVLAPASEDAIPDVVVIDGEVPERLDGAAASEPQWDADPRVFLWRGGPQVGRFLVENGRRITLQRSPGADVDRLRAQLLDTVLAVVLRQRGFVVLHANAAVTPTGAVVVAGESGAGKSTTLAALLAHGCVMLSDDVTALRVAADSRIEVMPGAPQLFLTDASAAGLGRDMTALARDPGRRNKSIVPAGSQQSFGPAPLRAIYLLERDESTGVRQCLLSGRASFSGLQQSLYGPILITESATDLEALSRVARAVPVVRLTRPRLGWTANEVAEAILRG